MATDYNSIIETIRQAQDEGEAMPGKDKPRIEVDSNAGIRVSDAASTDPAISQVQHGTFAAAVSAQRRARYERDLRVARQKLPPGTYYVDTPGADGWYYRIVTRDLQNEYFFCAAFDGTDYKVRLMEPELEKKYAGHSGHLFSGGKVCLTPNAGAGQPTLELAYSKSVLWAYGMDLVQNGHPFPFNPGEDGA